MLLPALPSSMDVEPGFTAGLGDERFSLDLQSLMANIFEQNIQVDNHDEVLMFLNIRLYQSRGLRGNRHSHGRSHVLRQLSGY